MPENLLGGQAASLLTAIVVVAIALLALVGVLWLVRKRNASTFIRGGKNRMPRLAVLDATAVDTRRRLVLIRRDDVEHLVMIGGPTDIVIESGIPQALQTRTSQQADQAMQQQRAAQTAPPARPAAPQRPRSPSPAPAPSVATATDRGTNQDDAGAGQPRRPQQPPQAPAIAATAATVGGAATIRTEAADLLETARNRVFEEPEFDASDLEDLIAVPQPANQPKPPISVPSQPADSATSTKAQPTEDPIQAQTADVLETVRTRIFEEPTFDGNAFDELTADAPSTEQRTPQAARATMLPAAATARSPSPSPAPADARTSSDFEAVLAAELSEDPTLGSPRDNFLAAHYNEHQLAPDEDDRVDAPDVKPEQQPSRDSLEAEMEKLLGDLSRK
ncbi:MAG: flagellar biosynthetic protein FliO [Hoeflea sp.]|uniref:flagellar biosynthetic protein FliO n=1 Tax=Hoeflea sp. TaxID=1940281 RepID=UPI003EF71788